MWGTVCLFIAEADAPCNQLELSQRTGTLSTGSDNRTLAGSLFKEMADILYSRIEARP
jgi:hypothetical protein